MSRALDIALAITVGVLVAASVHAFVFEWDSATGFARAVLALLGWRVLLELEEQKR